MIQRELGVFLVVGCLTVLLDFGVYRSLVGMDLAAVDGAKAIGFLCGTAFAYFANRFWTFGHKPHAPGSGWRFAALYGGTLAANVLVNAWLLTVFAAVVAGVQWAFLCATGISAALNFLGMKLFVFKQRATSEFT